MKLRVLFSEINKQWCLVDYTGWTIFFHDRPSVVRKAKLYWYCYLNCPESEVDYYLNKIRDLNDV